MRRTRMRSAAVLAVVGGLVLAGCGSSGSSGGSKDNTKDSFNAAVGKVFNPSTKKGGIIKFADEGQQDSVDPGDTYYGYSWNFARLYGRALTMFTPAPGKASNQLVGDLAEGLGKSVRRRQDLDLHAAQGREVRGRHRRHLGRRQVRHRALHRQGRLPRRSDVLRLAAELAGGLEGSLQDPEPEHRLGDLHAGRPRRSSCTSRSRSPTWTTSAPRRRPSRCRRPRTPARTTSSTWSPAVRTCSPTTRTARASACVATRTGTPTPTPTARRCLTGTTCR